MNYISFRIHNRDFAVTNDCSVEPTQINKIKVVKFDELVSGFINYKNIDFKVIDISGLFHKRSLKKFDGLIFVFDKKDPFAIKFEGFYKIKDSLTGEQLLDLKALLYPTPAE